MFVQKTFEPECFLLQHMNFDISINNDNLQ